MTPRRRFAWHPPILGLLALAFLGLMFATGRLTPTRQLAQFEAKGVLTTLPERIQRVTLSMEAHSVTFMRHVELGWQYGQRPVSEELQAHLTMALGLMHRAGPIRVMTPVEYQPTPLAEFGLDAPRYRVTLMDQAQPVLEAHFGTPHPQALAQYMRLAGRDEVYLMSRFLGEVWEHVWEHVQALPAAE